MESLLGVVFLFVCSCVSENFLQFFSAVRIVNFIFSFIMKEPCNLTSYAGNVIVHGNITIEKEISGNINSISGNITAKNVLGHVKTISGDIRVS